MTTLSIIDDCHNNSDSFILSYAHHIFAHGRHQIIDGLDPFVCEKTCRYRNIFSSTNESNQSKMVSLTDEINQSKMIPLTNESNQSKIVPKFTIYGYYMISKFTIDINNTHLKIKSNYLELDSTIVTNRGASISFSPLVFLSLNYLNDKQCKIIKSKPARFSTSLYYEGSPFRCTFPRGNIFTPDRRMNDLRFPSFVDAGFLMLIIRRGSSSPELAVHIDNIKFLREEVNFLSNHLKTENDHLYLLAKRVLVVASQMLDAVEKCIEESKTMTTPETMEPVTIRIQF